MRPVIRVVLALGAALVPIGTLSLHAAPPKKSAATVNNLDEAQADFEEPEAQDFAYPVPWLKNGPPLERLRYANTIRQMCKAGWEPDRGKALAESKKSFDSASALCDDDPRLTYGYALILWKHGKAEEAVRLFEVDTAKGAPAFLPMKEAAVWARLQQGDFNRGLADLESIAGSLSVGDQTYPNSIQRKRSAMFLGRGIGFLSGPGRRDAIADAVTKSEKKIESIMPADLRDDYQKGRGEVVAREAHLTKLAARPAEEIIRDFEDRKADLSAKLSLLEDTKQLWAEYEDAKSDLDRERRRPFRVDKDESEKRQREDRDRRVRSLQDAQSKLGSIQYKIDKLDTRIGVGKTRGPAAYVSRKRLLNEELKALTENFATPEQVKAAVRSISAYVPWDLETERDRLLESYTVRIANEGK